MTLLEEVASVDWTHIILVDLVLYLFYKPNNTWVRSTMSSCQSRWPSALSLHWISNNYWWTAMLFYTYTGFTNKFFWLSIQRTLCIDKRHDNSKLSILFFVSDILQPIVMVWFIWTRLLTWISCNIFACNLQRYFTVPSRVSLLYVRNASRWYVISCLCKKKKKKSLWYIICEMVSKTSPVPTSPPLATKGNGPWLHLLLLLQTRVLANSNSRITDACSPQVTVVHDYELSIYNNILQLHLSHPCFRVNISI